MSFTFDMGGYNAEVEELTEASKKFRSMSQAVNKAAEYGWQFIAAHQQENWALIHLCRD